MRLIDADALRKDLVETLRLCEQWMADAKDDETKVVSQANWFAFLEAKLRLDNAPTIDAAPVRHGRWEKNDYLFIDTLYRCSVCGEEFYLENGTPQENQYYYCPNCGARMDGEEDDKA